MRNNLRERLEFEGYSTEVAENADSAATMCERIPFDVILADDASAVPQTDTPFIVLSSTASIESAVEALRRGAADFLTKPTKKYKIK
ncbi:MAG: sigma-54-dependent Fis family transcriptional regulator, partial [Alistipes sp.]|nr:sigma-54-dependent Fis family transcriptional regulator [Alistipes sp.]